MTSLEVIALNGLPLIKAGDDLVELIASSLKQNGVEPRAQDVLVVAQKIVSKAEGRMVDLATINPSAQAISLAADVDKDPRLVEVILSESARVVRARRNVLIVEHRLGFVMANAGVDQSNVGPMDGASHVLLLPENPDRSAETLRRGLAKLTGIDLAVVINDSFGRAWRQGTAGVAIGVAGLPAFDRSARTARPVRPKARGQRHRFRGRDRRRRFAGDGPGGRGGAGRPDPGLALVRAGIDGGQHPSLCKRGSVSMSRDLVVALSGGIGAPSSRWA